MLTSVYSLALAHGRRSIEHVGRTYTRREFLFAYLITKAFPTASNHG